MRYYHRYFTPDRSIPFKTENKGTYQLLPSRVKETTRRFMMPVPGSCILTRIRVVLRGSFPFSLLTSSYLQANIIHNNTFMTEGQIKFKTASDVGVVTRHQTKYPNIFFKEDDLFALELHTYILMYGINDLYVSAVVTFELP